MASSCATDIKGITMTIRLRDSLLALTLLTCSFALAHDGSHKAADEQTRSDRVLGKLDFPTSTQSAEAQAAFEQGMLLLHLFEYSFAEAEFQRAQAIDPDFAMAYWGEAMVHNYPVWDEQAPDKARAVLDKFAATPDARAARITSAREQDYFESLEILYGPAEGRAPKTDRDHAYERFLGGMAKRYPDDHEVRLFYALALMGSHAGVRDIPAYMESSALSQSVFYANREHPGAAHYLIHGVDDPIHAPLGLEAARALYIMAPDAGHSLHMTSHIFNALGMWEDVVIANTNAVRVSNEMRAERGKPSSNVGHGNFWLLYGLLQQGRQSDAKVLLTAAYEETTAIGEPPSGRMILDPDNDRVGSLVQMWARYMLETEGNDPAVGQWQFNTSDAFDPNLNVLYVNAMLAENSGDIQKHIAKFLKLKAELREDVMAQPEQLPFNLLYLDRLDVIEQQLKASLARANGKGYTALEYAREANRLESEMPFSFGPPFVDYPSAQLLGELALHLGEHEEAVAAFDEQLKRSRKKAQAVEGLARAEKPVGM
jgi:tetratricopeptide (TPR) repeat protein